MGSRSRNQSHEGSCPLHCPCLTRDSLRQPPSSRPLNQTHNTQWQRVQDQKKPRRVAQMCLLSSPRDKSKNSKRPLVSWMLTRTVSCLALTLLLPSLELENLFLMVRHQACSLRHLVQLTLHRWSCFSQKKWPEAPMMMIPSLKLLIPSKSTAKSTQKCSDTPFALLETNSPTPKLTTPTLNL